jgi:DNA-binding response OmpR family regulator
MRKQRILVVEDDAAIRQGIVDALESGGYTALEAADGDDGLSAALGAAYDLLLLDLILPQRDGFAILREVRSRRPALPVIVLTARGEEPDRLRGFRLGADDYVVKPFSVRELLARVAAVLRRTPERFLETTAVAFAGGVADLSALEVRFDDGQRETLSEREMELLRYLAENADRIVTREELLARVWGITAAGIETRTVDMHVARLREKLHDNAEEPRIVRTVRGKGYLFTTGEGAP